MVKYLYKKLYLPFRIAGIKVSVSLLFTPPPIQKVKSPNKLKDL